MIGIQNDFQMHSGNSRLLQFTIRDEDGVVVDITGADLRWELSKLDDAATLPAPKGAPILQKAVSTGIIIVDGPNGRADVDLEEVDTEPLKGDFYHELRMVLVGDTSTPSFGAVEILKNLVE